MKKLWGGRFSEKNSQITEKLSQSIHFDERLYKHDIMGSIAHARMLAKCGIITAPDCEKIIDGLKSIEKKIDSNEFEFKTEYEDIHMNIESHLAEMIGDAGKRLHTARSRNDQVALDSRLYLRDEVNEIQVLLLQLISKLVETAEKNVDVIMPGYTHMQVAQPVRFSHHVMAHAWSLQRDLERLEFVKKSISKSPIGVGALAGVNYKTDRSVTAQLLGFTDVTDNSMDTVADRDYMLNFHYFASVLGMHLSRMSEEIILWMTSEFKFIQLSDKVTTGSSIMPQKRNPDLAELIRGKTGRLYGNLMSLLTIMKGLPLTYNRDMQEDKEGLFDSIDTVKLSLEGMTEMFKEMKVNGEKMRKAVYSNYSTATDLADFLAMKGMPFREAHEVVGSIVNFCEKEQRDYFTLNIEDLKKFSDLFDTDSVKLLNPENSTERKVSSGSTSISEVRKQIEKMKSIMKGY